MNGWNFGAGEITRFFRALAVSAEDLGSVPSAYHDSTHQLELQLEDLMPSSGFCGHCTLHNAGPTLTHRETIFKK